MLDNFSVGESHIHEDVIFHEKLLHWVTWWNSPSDSWIQGGPQYAVHVAVSYLHVR